AAAGSTRIGHTQFCVLLLEDARRQHEADATGRKPRLRVSQPEGLQPAQVAVQLRGDLRQRKLAIELKYRLEIRGRKPRARIAVERVPQHPDALRRQGEAYGVGMASEACEQLAAGLQRVQQVEAGNRATRAVGLPAVDRNN